MYRLGASVEYLSVSRLRRMFSTTAAIRSRAGRRRLPATAALSLVTMSPRLVRASIAPIRDGES